MPWLKKIDPAYLSFTRKERTGIILLSGLILIISLIPLFYPAFIKPIKTDPKELEKAIAGLQVREKDSAKFGYRVYEKEKRNYSSYKKNEESLISGELFSFDPNTLSVDGWQRLGLREKTIQTIQNYIAKGGRFRQPEDISKIWGLREAEINRLMPYVVISKPSFQSETKPYKKEYDKRPELAPFDINKADTTAFIALPGIGSKLASRIIAFRDKLGGFYRIDQIGETYGLPDSTFQKIKKFFLLNHPEIKQLNINTATVDELKIHPYIRYNLANALVAYRNSHGRFTSVADIKKIMMVTDELFEKLAPYLSAG